MDQAEWSLVVDQYWFFDGQCLIYLHSESMIADNSYNANILQKFGSLRFIYLFNLFFLEKINSFILDKLIF